MDELHDISLASWQRLLGSEGEPLPEACLKVISSTDFKYRILSDKERDLIILRVIKALHANLEPSGPHRLKRWQDGWAENLEDFKRSGYNPESLVPKFVKTNEAVRMDGNYIMPNESAFETRFVTVLRNFLFTKWFAALPAVYEFGCGTGHNLVALAKLFPTLRLMGLDWAEPSQEILALLRSQSGLKIEGKRFDLFHPQEDFNLESGAGVFTIGTLEQLGQNFKVFLDWMMRQPFKVCINIETLYEVYDQTNLFDYLAASYLEKRNYLKGYVAELKRREAAGQLRILKLQRTFGSLFHDGYSYIVWEKSR